MYIMRRLLPAIVSAVCTFLFITLLLDVPSLGIKAPGFKELPVSTKPEISLKHLLYKHDVQFPRIVFNQAKQESGSGFSSYTCKVRNNPFGFRHRALITKTNKMGYLEFPSLDSAVKYYKDWQTRKFNSEEMYYLFLQKIGYAEDPLYINRLKAFK